MDLQTPEVLLVLVVLAQYGLSLQVWLTLADRYLHSISIDWDKTLRFTFNERSNPDDDSLGIQIVKVTRLYLRSDWPRRRVSQRLIGRFQVK